MNVLVVGATSAIAAACARLWAAQGANLFLVARDGAKLEAVAQDLRTRGAAAVAIRQMDATDAAAHGAMLQAALAALGTVDVALIAHGTLPDQAACEADPALALREFATNATSTIALLTLLAPVIEAQRRGTLAVISSVAGDRGRASNYVYGSAKAAVSTFCEGLRVRLSRAGGAVTDIRPGFIDTPMTAGLPLPQALVARPEDIAPRIVRAVAQGRAVVYVPAFWWAIMAVIRALPRFVFHRMNL